MNNGEEKDIKKQIGLKWLSYLIATLTVLVTLYMFYASVQVANSSQEVKTSSDNYINTQITASQLKQGSENLTKHVRSFVVTGQKKFLDYYFVEKNETKTYDNAYAELEQMVEDGSNLQANLQLINSYEDKLKEFEGRAILLVLDYYGIEDSKYKEYLSSYSLSTLEQNLEPEDKLKKAIALVFGDDSSNIHFGDYEMNKRIVDENIDSFVKQLASIAQYDQQSSMKELDSNVGRLRRTILGAMIFLLAVVAIILRSVVSPLVNNIKRINGHDYLEEKGVDEIKTLARSYNQMLTKVKDNQQKLSYEASHDALTGLLNRQAYLDTMPSFEGKNIAFLHIDVDDFKHINDFYGHDVGDQFLKKLANILQRSFRSGDLIYRLGGDEFAVIMIGVREYCEPIIMKKAEQIEEELKNTDDGLPSASVSIGAAFSQGDGNVDNMYKEADLALYEAKNSGKGRIVMYEEYMENHLKQSNFH